jgi:hypothetical protein
MYFLNYFLLIMLLTRETRLIFCILSNTVIRVLDLTPLMTRAFLKKQKKTLKNANPGNVRLGFSLFSLLLGFCYGQTPNTRLNFLKTCLIVSCYNLQSLSIKSIILIIESLKINKKAIPGIQQTAVCTGAADILDMV